MFFWLWFLQTRLSVNNNYLYWLPTLCWTWNRISFSPCSNHIICVIISSLKMLKLVFRELRQFLRGHKASIMAEAVFKALTYRLIITILHSDKSTRLIFWFCDLQAPYATPLKPTNKNGTPEPWSTCLGIKLKWLKTTPKKQKTSGGQTDPLAFLYNIMHLRLWTAVENPTLCLHEGSTFYNTSYYEK